MAFFQKLWPWTHSANIDGVVFKLYYRCTVLMLVFFSFVITCRLLFGDSFFCETLDPDFLKMGQTYCYTHGPFVDLSVIKDYKTTAIHPGVPHTLPPLENRVRMPYYPWVNLFLLVLAILFYLPHLIWKVCEGGLVKRLTLKVNDSSVSESERKAAIIEIAKYLITTRGGHWPYMGVYVLSEILNWLLGILLKTWLDSFFDAGMYYKTDMFKIETWDDFFAYNFPLMGLCIYPRYGLSGDVHITKIMCHLPLNNLYGYLFLFLRAWIIFLCTLQSLVIICRLFGLVLPPIRILLFRLKSEVTDQTLLNFANTTFSLGDWFLLTRLQKNLLAHDFTKLLSYAQQNIHKSPVEMEMDDLAKMA